MLDPQVVDTALSYHLRHILQSQTIGFRSMKGSDQAVQGQTFGPFVGLSVWNGSPTNSWGNRYQVPTMKEY